MNLLPLRLEKNKKQLVLVNEIKTQLGNLFAPTEANNIALNIWKFLDVIDDKQSLLPCYYAHIKNLHQFKLDLIHIGIDIKHKHIRKVNKSLIAIYNASIVLQICIIGYKVTYFPEIADLFRE